MKFEASNREIFSLAWPVVLGAVAQQVVGLTDTAFLGHWQDGKTALGASALAGVWYFAVFTFAWGLTTGVQSLVARRLGEDRPEGVGQVLRVGLGAGAVLSVVIVALVLVATGPVFGAVIESEAVRAEALTYVYYRVWDIPFMVLYVVFRGFFSGIGQNRIVMVSALVMAATNCGLNYVLIFGKLGFPALGIGGAALATAIAEMTCAFVIAGFFFRQGLHRTYPIWQKAAQTANGSELRNLVSLSVPTSLQHLMSVGSFFLMFAFIEKLGEQALGASGLVKSVYIFLMIPIWGFATAAGTLISNLLGQNRPDDALRALRHICTLSLGICLGYLGVIFIFPEPVLRIFSEQPGLVSDSIPLLRIVIVAILVYSISGILMTGVISTGAGTIAAIIEVGGVVAYLAYIYATAVVWKAPLPTVWLCEILYMVLMLVPCALYLKFGNWRSISRSLQVETAAPNS